MPWTICPIPLLRGLMSPIRKVYLIIEVIWAECSLFACSLLFARWLFNSEEMDRPLAARFNSDSCKAFLLAFCFSNRIFNSEGLEWLGLEDKKSSALCSEFFLQRLFLIKGRWFITSLSRGNPVPCYPNMHFPKEIERTKSVAVDTVSRDPVKYLVMWCSGDLYLRSFVRLVLFEAPLTRSSSGLEPKTSLFSRLCWRLIGPLWGCN